MCCRLSLEVSGAPAVGLHLNVVLSISLAPSNVNVVDGQDASSSNSCVHVASLSKEIEGVGEVHCDGIWPLEMPVSCVICRVELAVREWSADVYRYETQWIAACQEPPDEDT